ncbi:MAG: OmpH family outer membrane protein [Phaeodactylibacter sp.]|nr:OmpH family outer membrane protein [Phaeodactylibacter sp.]MCB9263911.1 OmpH family outer membrane protein [Lewinellaceae bacterium]MCB9288163.1 OmpH family outer membrane protein [Lewinellaceae bacterium]
MKRIVTISCLLLMVIGAMSTVQAQKFGYVNSTAILAEMPEVKQMEANLEALQKQLQKKGQSMVEQLQQDYAVVQQKAASGDLSPKQQEEEAKKLEDQQAEIAKFEQDMMKQLQDKRNKELQPILEKVNQAITDVAKENGFQFIFDEGVILYAADSQNVEDLVKAKLGL